MALASRWLEIFRMFHLSLNSVGKKKKNISACGNRHLPRFQRGIVQRDQPRFSPGFKCGFLLGSLPLPFLLGFQHGPAITVSEAKVLLKLISSIDMLLEDRPLPRLAKKNGHLQKAPEKKTNGFSHKLWQIMFGPKSQIQKIHKVSQINPSISYTQQPQRFTPPPPLTLRMVQQIFQRGHLFGTAKRIGLRIYCFTWFWAMK